MVGELIQHYRILQQLGAGGMGVVYEAEDTRLGRHVAIKFLPDSMNSSAEVVERFEREAKTLAALNHPNICAIYDIGTHDNRRFIVMERLDGQPLRERIDGRAMPIDQLVDVGCQLADALDAAHAKGIVHRDIKPANIFITKRGQAKLLDFGIAKLGGDQLNHTPADQTRLSDDVLTSPGMAVGSINYMSPEQARGEDIDGRTDLFSLGLVLYEMATGRQAFGGQTTAVVFDAILNRQPPQPTASNPDIPAELERVIFRSLEKDRKMRFQTAADMMAELGRIRRDTTSGTAASPAATAASGVAGAASTASSPFSPSSPSPTSPGDTTAHPGGRPRWLVAAGLAVPALAVAGYLLWGGGTPTPAFVERDIVLIADFVNTTGDAVFDDALRQAVSIQLQQTPFVTILPDQQVQRTLRLMQRSDGEPVTGAVAREACQRAGAAATVEGSISPIGTAYVLTLGVHNCETGESLAQEQVQADAKEQVLATLGNALTSLRQRMGESLGSIEQYDVPVTEATTGSLEALKAYGLGLRARVTQGDDEALPFFNQAVALDPSFALAHAKLAVVHGNQGRLELAKEHAEQAYALRDRVSEYERLYINWNYASRVLAEPQKVKEALDLIVAAYPRDFSARNNLGVYYMGLARYSDAVEQFLLANEIAPDEPLPLQNASFALLFKGDREEAYAMMDRTQAVRPTPNLLMTKWISAVMANDPRAEEYKQQTAAQTPPDQLLQASAQVALWSGQLAEWSRLITEGRAQLSAAGETQAVAQIDQWEVIARAALERGPALERMKTLARTASTPTTSRLLYAAILAALGDVEAARSVARALDGQADDLRARNLVTAIGAYSLAADGQTAQAIAELEGVLRESPQAADVYVHIGSIKRAAGDLEGAAVAFQKTVDARFQLGADIPVIMAKFLLAEVRGEQGRAEEAKVLVDELLAQWAEADTEFWMLERVREMGESIS